MQHKLNYRATIEHYDTSIRVREYEAENYAIKAMRAEGIPVPRIYLDDAKIYIDHCIRKWPEVSQSDEVLRFAYGKDWTAVLAQGWTTVRSGVTAVRVFVTGGALPRSKLLRNVTTIRHPVGPKQIP